MKALSHAQPRAAVRAAHSASGCKRWGAGEQGLHKHRMHRLQRGAPFIRRELAVFAPPAVD